MASSIIHLAVTKELTKRYKFKDENRLKFGAILPDAGRGKDSHLKKAVWGLNKRVYDFERFELIHKNFPDLDMNIVIPNENNMYRFMELIEANHGTVQDYFSSIGITTDIQQKIIEKLCEG